MCTKTTRSLHVLLIKQIVVLESREKRKRQTKRREKEREQEREGGGRSEREREQSNLYGHKTRKNIRII